MKQVKALSIDNFFKEMTIGSKTALTVHSVFERTINIMIEGELFTLASNQIDNAPATVVIDLPTFNECEIVANAHGFLSPNSIEITGYLTIDLTTTPTWVCQLHDFSSHHEHLVKNILVSKQEIVTNGNAKWLLKKEGNLNAFDKEMCRMLNERTTKLIAGFNKNDTSLNSQNAKQLIGLGQGLTPSGDDFLVGLLLAFSTSKKDQFHQQKWSEQVSKEAKSNTNIISYSAIKYAAIGQTRETIVLFIEALNKEENDEKVKRALANVIKIGSSSGTEMAWGIINGLTLLLKQEEQNDNTSKN